MSKRCSTCGRGSQAGNNRSHSNIKTKRRFHVNLQWRRIDGVQFRVCTRCLRTRTKALRAAAA
ncbi:50S ribosomal protein L28 [Candidatus Uhrbacteria bacterium]|nr:50S ribosomal protein L28 [Candidatus Uhrbacteria bacterium]